MWREPSAWWQPCSCVNIWSDWTTCVIHALVEQCHTHIMWQQHTNVLGHNKNYNNNPAHMSTFHEIELHYHICCVMPRTLKTTYNCINQAVNSMSGQCQENMNYIHLLRYRQYLGVTNATTTAKKTRITATATAATTTVTTTTNIATGETSQAITPFHFFVNYNFHH